MTNEEIFGMLHHVMGLARRGPHHVGAPTAPPPPPFSDAKTPPPPPPPPMTEEPACSPDAVRSYRERGRLLICLEREDGIPQKQLAERVNIRPQSLSELLQKLEQDGMIERHPHELDKRTMLVYLSDLGRARLDDIKAERKRFADEFFAPLTEEEKQQLADILDKLIRARTLPNK